MERKVPVGEIARQLGRHRSTIYRELKRNSFHDAEFP
ncbi:IS30 family transposase, partial [Sinorhizobium sp. M4_45]